MTKQIKLVIEDNGLETVLDLNRDSPDFDENLGEAMCEIFDSPSVKYHIELPKTE